MRGMNFIMFCCILSPVIGVILICRKLVPAITIGSRLMGSSVPRRGKLNGKWNV